MEKGWKPPNSAYPDGDLERQVRADLPTLPPERVSSTLSPGLGLQRRPKDSFHFYAELAGSGRPNASSRMPSAEEPNRASTRLAQRRAHCFQPLQGAEDLRLIVGEMAHEYVCVPQFPEAAELGRDLVN